MRENGERAAYRRLQIRSVRGRPDYYQAPPDPGGAARLADMILRLMTERDLPGVLAVQMGCYQPDYHEPESAFRSKLSQCPDTCWVIERASGGASGPVEAYLVSLPVAAGALPALHQGDWRRPPQATSLYLHDLAVGPALRGSGAAARLIEQASLGARQRGLSSLVLVAVQGSVPFWQRHGFQDVSLTAPERPASLHSFGPQATFMTRAS